MVCHGIPWYTMAYYGILWHTMAYYGILWHTMAYYGILWYPPARAEALAGVWCGTEEDAPLKSAAIVHYSTL